MRIYVTRVDWYQTSFCSQQRRHIIQHHSFRQDISSEYNDERAPPDGHLGSKRKPQTHHYEENESIFNMTPVIIAVCVRYVKYDKLY